jgi:hypothetical protein
LYLNTTPIGVSRGGLTFDPGKEIRQIPFDSAKSPLKLLDRVIKVVPVITGKMLEYAGGDIPNYEAGATSSFASASGVTGVITPKMPGLMFASGDYLANLKLVFERGMSTIAAPAYIEIIFPYAICRKYKLTGTDQAEAEVDVEFEARIDPSASGNSIFTSPYTIAGVSTP